MNLVVLAMLSQAEQPYITHVSLASPDLLAIEITSGRVVVPAAYANPDYAPGGSAPASREAVKDGRMIGTLIGWKGEQIQPVEKASGTHWNPSLAADVSSITLTGAGSVHPSALMGRKSFPGNIARTGGWEFADAERFHRLYIKLSSPPKSGSWTLKVPGLAEVKTAFDSRKVRTEGLRVQQTGFRPDDPAKSALFSLWTGSGGALDWTPSQFELLDAKTLKPVFTGKAALHHDGKSPDSNHGDIGSLAPVYKLDFSAFKTPGTYRLHLPGVGCSYDFELASDAWSKIFATSLKGFYFQRNGIKHGAPYSAYTAPRAFNPTDGWQVFHSSCSLMDSENGINALGTDKDNFANLMKGATDTVVANAWGGYKDAGDWDTRIQHLEATRRLLELAELFPDSLKVKINIPESGKGLPDILAEAQWNLDHFRRMQTPEGGIRGGIEFAEHPRFGETSWTNSYKAYAYAPDPWSSWLYAGTAARFSVLVKSFNPSLAATFLSSAVKAYDWGTAEKKRLNRDKYPADVRDSQNLAAASLLHATGAKKYEDDFLATCRFLNKGAELFIWQEVDQGEAAALVVHTQKPSSAVAAAKEALTSQADKTMEMMNQAAYRSARHNKWTPPGYGQDVSGPGTKFLIWAHQATKDEKYLKAALEASGFQLGINPSNVVYTSGVGTSFVQRPFMVDPRYIGDKFPPGITVFGPLWHKTAADGPWWKIAEPFVYPSGDKWPVSESWFDSYWTIMMNEFTIMQSMGPTSHTWGYLAFRKQVN